MFIKHIEIANELNLPIVIHSRDAAKDTIDILKENNVKKQGIFHCCQLNRFLVEEALKLANEHHIEVEEHEHTVGHIINLFLI